jgi:phosphoenolpyruvate phosphomutase
MKNLVNRLNNTDDTIIVGGAHDVLSARIIENCKYDAIWLSGLCVSVALKGVPDASIVTATESIEVCRNISNVVDVPIIIDMDSGYGNAINVFYYSKLFAKAGAAGICIEDNPYPKCNSFFNEVDKNLISVKEMKAKIRAVKDATGDDFLVIARNEALIQKEPLEKILNRCHEYIDAGADALVVHAASWESMQPFLETWKEKIPLVVIPTKLQTVSPKILKKYFRVIIYANQLLRASIRHSEIIMKQILNEGLDLKTELEISSMEEVFNYNEMWRLVELEKEYLK